MKMLLTILSALVLTSSAFAGPAPEDLIKTGKIDLQFPTIIASPAFAQALAKATTAVNGWKLRMDYKSDHTSRTTVDTITVTTAGRIRDTSGKNIPDLLQKAEFIAVGYNGGWQVKVSEVKVTQITEEEFVKIEF